MTTLLSDIEAFIATHEMTATRFGDVAMSDRHFVRQLRTGRRVWPETERRARAFMATYTAEPQSAAA